MALTLLASGIAGTVFGAALTASGVYSPEVILLQMQLTDFHMLKVFVGASAGSALIMLVLDRLNLWKRSPRSSSSLGWFGYDGNVIGGLLHGIGMTFSGACPGTCFVQLGLGIRSGLYTVLGGVLGGIVYVKWAKYLRRTPPAARDAKEVRTVYERLGVNEASAVMGYETVCLGILTAATQFAPPRPDLLNPAIGGLLIAGSQASSILLSGNALGVSSVYEDVGKRFWHAVDTTFGTGTTGEKLPASKSIVFAAGLVVGGLLTVRTLPAMIAQSDIHVPAARAVIGGFAMSFGARLAGGCTSGHGISGMSMLSVSSFITVASMFAGGISLALLLE